MFIRSCLSILSILLLVYLVFPLVVVLGASVTSSEFLSFPPHGFTMKWYAAAFSQGSYLPAIWTSTLLAAVATLIAIVLTIPATLAIARYDFFGRRAVESLLMSSLILPYVVLGAALLQYGTMIGIVRTFPGLVVGHVVIIMPFIMRSVLPQFSEDQKDLEEASRDLGAGAVTTFFLITLPQIRAGVVSGAILAFITSWINVEISMFQSKPDLTTLPVALFNYVQYSVDPTIAAVSSVTILGAAGLIILLDLLFGIDLISKRK